MNQQPRPDDQKAVNRDGLSAIAITLVAVVLVAVAINHFV